MNFKIGDTVKIVANTLLINKTGVITSINGNIIEIETINGIKTNWFSSELRKLF